MPSMIYFPVKFSSFKNKIWLTLCRLNFFQDFQSEYYLSGDFLNHPWEEVFLRTFVAFPGSEPPGFSVVTVITQCHLGAN